MNYKKYRWMLTSSGSAVFGGKSAEQNEEVVKFLMEEANEGRKYMVMHTSAPGSPFAVLFSKEYMDLDVKECAIFCGCFSRAWREGKKETSVDMFFSSDLFKLKDMKAGTFGVAKKLKSMKVRLELCLEVQEGKLRAVPRRRVATSNIVLKPGKTPKEKVVEELSKMTGFKKEEVLEALPTGGFDILKCK